MDEEIDVSEQPSKEENVSFIEDSDTTVVTVGEEKKDGNRAGNDEERERLRTAEAHQLRLAADIADLRAIAIGRPSQTGGGPGPDPWKTKEDSITQQERALGIQWEAHKAARTLTPERLEEFDTKSRELQSQRMEIAASRAIANAMPSLVATTQEQRFRSEYSDVRADPLATRWARGEYDKLVAQGAPENEETIRQAMNAARRQFRLGGRSNTPTEQDRRQMTGYSGSGRATSGPKNNVVRMGKSEKIMAMAMYGDRFNGDEKKSYAAWAKGPGLRAAKAINASKSGR